MQPPFSVAEIDSALQLHAWNQQTQTKKMKIPALFAASVALVMMAVPFESKGKDPEFKPPGTEENAAVDQANAKVDAVYKQLMSKLDADGQKALKEAERAWIKWRDDEAMLMARVGGVVGGSSMRVDFANAQKKLIDQRIEVLNGYLKQAAADR
ncbi:MAG: Lysozyme inhibitor LprI [Verrucomicrobiota bacterium]|jgi:uncharacterized protein YecT (DUF1311 family)